MKTKAPMMSMRAALAGFAVLVLMAIGAGGRAHGQDTEAPPLVLAITFNDGQQTPVYHGWPLIVQLDAALMDDVSAPVPLDPAAAVLNVQSAASGAEVKWPLRAVGGSAGVLKLDNDHLSARLTWMIEAGQSAALAPGEYRLSASWAGKSAAVVRITVTEPPATLSADDDVRLAILQSRVALVTGKTEQAPAVLTQALARHPDTFELLVQLATLHEQRGEYAPAHRAAQQAIELFFRGKPKTIHPPRALLQMEGRIFKALLEEARKNPPPRATAPVAASAIVSSAPIGVTAPKSPAVPSTPAMSAVAPVITSVFDGKVVPSSELSEANILADPNGQWASSAKASSEYGAPNYSAAKVIGAPDVPSGGDSVNAWCPHSSAKGLQWIEAGFAKNVHATEVRVRQSYNPGAIVKVEAIDSAGVPHLWWAGVDPSRPSGASSLIAWFAVRVPKTDYLVTSVRVTLDIDTVASWQEIDAVQLVGSAD